MSDSNAIEEPRPVTKVLRTVTPGSRPRRDVEMDSIGWMLFLGMVILLVPLLPFFLIVWAIGKTLDFLQAQRGA
jgi:hypothetical protein